MMPFKAAPSQRITSQRLPNLAGGPSDVPVSTQLCMNDKEPQWLGAVVSVGLEALSGEQVGIGTTVPFTHL